eukprot:TRINITY_DN3555_c0_g1_i1.p2 TRINITY_DN3555_c0_g1~~TRINITY_DN3555_c0_g1_i1.p2  ORF type:complete len:137 (-),score=33.69 TRINITY_DN3555_c0_g1_i1:1027-1437(-)
MLVPAVPVWDGSHKEYDVPCFHELMDAYADAMPVFLIVTKSDLLLSDVTFIAQQFGLYNDMATVAPSAMNHVANTSIEIPQSVDWKSVFRAQVLRRQQRYVFSVSALTRRGIDEMLDGMFTAVRSHNALQSMCSAH